MTPTATHPDWQIKKLGEICEISTGKSNANEAVENGEYAFFDRSKTIKRSSRFLFDCEALIIPGEGAEFFPRYFSGKFDLHQRAYALFDFNKSVDVRFIEYYLILDHKYFERVAVGATAKSLRRRHFEDLQIPLPPLPEQKRIVRILDEAFAAAERARETAEQNLASAKELFESYLQSVFVSGGGDWEEKELGEIAVFSQGIQIGLEKHLTNQKKGYVRFIRIIDYTQNTEDIRYVPDPGNKYFVDSNDIVMVRYGTPGLIGRGKAGVIANNLFKITMKEKNLLNDYLCFYLSQKSIQRYLSTQGSATMPALNFGQLKTVIISFPPLKTQKQIVTKLDQLSAETKKLEGIYQQKLDNLAELKKSILSQAFAGEL